MATHLTDTEYRFVSLVWDHEPLGSGALVALAQEALGWKKSTTYTMLRRLCARGILKNVDATVTTCISRSEVQEAMSQEMVDTIFSGSLPRFIAAFSRKDRLSKEDIDALRQLIDKSGED